MESARRVEQLLEDLVVGGELNLDAAPEVPTPEAERILERLRGEGRRHDKRRGAGGAARGAVDEGERDAGELPEGFARGRQNLDVADQVLGRIAGLGLPGSMNPCGLRFVYGWGREAIDGLQDESASARRRECGKELRRGIEQRRR